MAVNKVNADALRAAMGLVLAGSVKGADKSLTWNAVCAEADVPRATAARATDIIAEWKAALTAAKALPRDAENGSEPVTSDGKGERDLETVRALRETVRTMANHIQVLSLALARKDDLIAALQAQSGHGKVTVLSKR